MKVLLMCQGAVLGMFLDVKHLLMNPVKGDCRSIWAAIYRKILLLLNLSLGYSNVVMPWEGLRHFCQRKRWGRIFWPCWFHWVFFHLFQDLSQKVQEILEGIFLYRPYYYRLWSVTVCFTWSRGNFLGYYPSSFLLQSQLETIKLM